MPSACDRAAAPKPVDLKTWIGFIAMSFGMLMAILDIQIVASSLPEIQVGLHLPLAQLTWVQTAYLMAEIVAIPLTGWLTRVLSTRGAFVVGVAGFTAASVACALSTGFWSLIPARVAQGFCGGLLIPLVFSAVFLIFPSALRPRATAIAGAMAMLAPTLGPTVGGFITDRYSWHWLFLINVGPGILVALLAALLVDCDRAERGSLGSVDLWSLPPLAVFLGTLEVVLNEAPRRGWGDPLMLLLTLLCLGCGVWTIRRCLTHSRPLIELECFRDRNFALGCGFSFALGLGLYGATYLLPVFLGVVRYYEALDIGLIMIVTGAAQLAMAPLAAWLEPRVEARVLLLAGYGLFAVGLIGNGFMTFATDFWGLFGQQLARGAAVMLCILPSTALALEALPAARVPNASGCFNLMRNLGGAIGLGLIDTIIQNRTPAHIKALVARLQAGDPAAARIVGLPTERFTGVPITHIDQATRDVIAPLVRRAGLVAALNDAWLFIGVLVLVSLLLLPLMRRTEPRDAQQLP
ncbi:MAG TPA: DHA2 family efflux MFS transporter permease subunit [Stellaceae bacterium]|jgi:DHA2 family multidrug resistance protein|nr:DHA2 family efflux MFS transporter permease subunit [Stellaceae bacterium]